MFRYTIGTLEAFENPDLQWGIRENDKIDLLTVHIYIPI